MKGQGVFVGAVGRLLGQGQSEAGPLQRPRLHQGHRRHAGHCRRPHSVYRGDDWGGWAGTDHIARRPST
jgi:hypothetical protein